MVQKRIEELQGERRIYRRETLVEYGATEWGLGIQDHFSFVLPPYCSSPGTSKNHERHGIQLLVSSKVLLHHHRGAKHWRRIPLYFRIGHCPQIAVSALKNQGIASQPAAVNCQKLQEVSRTGADDSEERACISGMRKWPFPKNLSVLTVSSYSPQISQSTRACCSHAVYSKSTRYLKITGETKRVCVTRVF